MKELDGSEHNTTYEEYTTSNPQPGALETTDSDDEDSNEISEEEEVKISNNSFSYSVTGSS